MKTFLTWKSFSIAVLSALVASLLVACGGGDSDDNTGDTIKLDGIALGLGTDVFGQYATEANTKARVLDLDALNAQRMLVINRNVEEATFISNSGTSISEYAQSLGVSVGVAGQYKFFTASIDSRFERDYYSSEEYAFATMQELFKKTSLKVGEQYRGASLRNFLTPHAAEALRTWEPAQIVAAYGTHVMVGIFEGARLDYSMTFEATKEVIETGVSVYATVGFKMAFQSAQVGTGVTESQMTTVRNTMKHVHVEAKGGMSQFAHCESNPETCDQARLTWLNSIDQNPVFCAIMHDGLIPIWELAADPEQRAKIEAYYKAYAIGKHVQYPFPRYEVTELTIIDHHTGLMWARKRDVAIDANSNLRAHYYFWLEQLIPPVNSHLRYAGFSDWRMPGFEELWSLVDHSRAPAALVDDRFGMVDGLYWSSTEAEDDPAKVQTLILNSGRTYVRTFTVPKAHDAIGATMGAAILVRDAY